MPPALVVRAPLIDRVLAPSSNPRACTDPVTEALPPATLTNFRPLAPPMAPVTLLPLFRISVPVFAVLVVTAPISVRPAPRLKKPSPTKFVAAIPLPNRLTVPVPLTAKVCAKTGPLKVTVSPAAPALIWRKRVPVWPVLPVTVEVPENKSSPVPPLAVVNAPPASLLVLIFWLSPMVKIASPVVSTPLS